MMARPYATKSPTGPAGPASFEAVAAHPAAANAITATMTKQHVAARNLFIVPPCYVADTALSQLSRQFVAVARILKEA
jgi:hypothetical protein